MPTYIRPSGKEITINEASVKYAESQGWKKKEAVKKEPVKKFKKAK